MNNVIGTTLDAWMVFIHGDKHTDSLPLRLATLVFCLSLPKRLSDDLSKVNSGNTSIIIELMARVPECSPKINNPKNILEKFISSSDSGLMHSIYLPLEYNKETHIQASGLLKSFAIKNLGCEVQVTSTKDLKLKFEFLHLESKRYLSFTLST